MAEFSCSKYVKKVCGLLVIMPIFAITGCGEGDGPVRIQGTAATPLPPGFEDRVPNLGVYSETNTDPTVGIQDIQQAGNEVIITTETVRVFEGTVSLGLTFTTGDQGFGGSTILFNDADVSAYNTLRFSIDTSSFANFANLTVQLEPPPGGTNGGFAFLADYTPVATSGTWDTYEIPLAAFPAVDLALVNKLGFFNARDGGDTLLAGTLYLDDIHFAVTDVGGSGPIGNPIDPEVVLYATEGDPDLVIPDDYDSVTDLGSGSVPNLLFADDDTYSKVLSVFSGTNSGANVAKVGFVGFDPGFATFYDDLIFKIKGMPNFVVFVSLYEGGNRVRINLTSSGFAEELQNGWYQVSIPISSFSGLTTATGIVFESDDTAETQFTMFLTDIGFTEADLGGDGGDCDNGGATDPNAIVFDDDFGDGVSFAPFGGSINDVTVDSSEAYSGTAALKVVVPSAEYTGGAMVVNPGRDVSAYDTLTFWAKASDARTLNVAGIGNDGVDVSNATEVSNLALTTEWQQFTITIPNPSALTANTGLFHFAEGSDEGVYTIWFDEITYASSSGGGGGDCGDGGTGGATDPVAVVFDDDYGDGVSFAPFGGSINDVTVDSSEAYSGTAALKVVVPSAEYTGGAMVVNPGRDVSAYNRLTFWAKASDARTLNVAGIGNDGVDVSNATEVSNLALTTEWQQFTITIPDPSVLTANTGLFHFAEGSDEGVYTIWFDEITYSSSSGSSGGNGGSGDGGFVNGDFENGLTGWSLFQFPEGVGSITADTSMLGGRAGTVGRLQVAGSAASANDAVISQEFLGAGTIMPGDSIDVSFDLYGSLAGAGGVVFVEIIFLNAAGEDVGGRNFLNGDPAPYAPTDTWTPYSGSVIAGTGAGDVTGFDVSGGVVLSMKAACGAVDGCAVDASFDNVTFTIN